ncbi:MAG: hypothetical protein IKQ59_14055 [Prevotella sp.]|nr:hypothetical protein [Prevotella sp.]
MKIFKNQENTAPLEQELAAKAKALEAQRKERERNEVQLVLDRILSMGKSHSDEIVNMLSGNGSNTQRRLRDIIWRELMEASGGDLMCREYRERRKSEQRIIAYTGKCWVVVDQQQWQYFMNHFAMKCGMPETLFKEPSFMKKVWEHTAFSLFEWCDNYVPYDETWLNMSNGTLVIRRDGSMPILRDHRREDMFFYVLDYPYDPSAVCPLWDAFLQRVLPEPEQRLVLGEFVGYTFMGTHIYNKMLWMYGPGANGKSVVLEILEALLGTANVSSLSLADITSDPTKRVGIEGKLLNISYETGKDVRADVMKLLSGGEAVTVKYLYENPYTTRNYGQFAAAFNTLPKAEITGAFFRRLILMPFDVVIPEEEQDKELPEKLKAELSGILNWVVEALQGLMQRKAFTSSKACEEALTMYRMQSDSVSMFCHEMCEKVEYATRGDVLFTAYKKYCYDSNMSALGKINFYKRLDAVTHSRNDDGHLPCFNLKIIEL